jgi:hypothetical protein
MRLREAQTVEGAAMARLGVSLTVLLISASLVQGTKAGQGEEGDGLIILARLGDISDGHCKCRDQCEAGQSIFSRDRTIAQCERKCQQAFSGCTTGEARSTQRRDLIAGPAPAPTPASAHDPRRNFAECAKEMGLMRDPSDAMKLQSGRTIRRWRLNTEAQMMTFNDCVARKART